MHFNQEQKLNYSVIAGIHAREWVAPAMALYLINRLVNDLEARSRELSGIDWYILPVVNPDGYEFTRSSPEVRKNYNFITKVSGDKEIAQLECKIQ